MAVLKTPNPILQTADVPDRWQRNFGKRHAIVLDVVRNTSSTLTDFAQRSSAAGDPGLAHDALKFVLYPFHIRHAIVQLINDDLIYHTIYNLHLQNVM